MITRQMGEFERWASGIASTAMGSWGMRRGGVVGLLALAGAGFIAWRAGAGQSVLPESGRKLLEKALPSLAVEPPRKAPARRAPAKAKAAPATTRRTAKASTAASRTSGTKASAAPKAAGKSTKVPAKAAETPVAAKRAPRRKAPITAANGSEAASKTIN